MAKESSQRMGQIKVLPDTNILIAFLKGEEPYTSAFKTWIKEKQLAISPILVAEFLTGANEKESKSLDSLLEIFGVLPINERTARIAADIRKNSLKRKTKALLPDCLLAAQCLQYNLFLATINKKDFPKDIKTINFS